MPWWSEPAPLWWALGLISMIGMCPASSFAIPLSMPKMPSFAVPITRNALLATAVGRSTCGADAIPVVDSEVYNSVHLENWQNSGIIDVIPRTAQLEHEMSREEVRNKDRISKDRAAKILNGEFREV